jgi:hypothetical protein
MTSEVRLAAGAGAAGRRSVQVAAGTLEALKWLALVAMTLDHVNRYLFGGRLAGWSEAGRLAMPLFGFVLAYHLAQPGALVRGVHGRVMRRLALAGVPAALALFAMGVLRAGWWPLNVMFMLLAVTGILLLLERGGDAAHMGAAGVFLFAGAAVDFWWFGIVFCLCAWWYCKTTSRLALAAWLLAAAALYFANQSHWALTAMPLVLAAPYLRLHVPRLRYLFYVYYPAHLAVLLLLARWLPALR